MVKGARRLVLGVAAVGTGCWVTGMGFVLAHRDWPALSPADAVVVLGTSSTVGGRPNPCMEVRVAEGVRLLQAGMAPVMIVSGGEDPHDGLVEAETMAAIAVRMGLSDQQVLLETSATSTIENITASREILAGRGLGERVILVTEPFHMPRAVLAADRLGVDAQAGPSSQCADRGPLWLVREPAAVLWYLWKLR